jgi:hypothetical protein
MHSPAGVGPLSLAELSTNHGTGARSSAFGIVPPSVYGSIPTRTQKYVSSNFGMPAK